MHDVNVIGSLQLLAALEKAPTVRTIVVRGSAGIYGAEPHAPQFFTEEMTRLFPLRSRFQRDVAEIENYFETYSRRHPEVVCTMLRYQPAIGPSVDSQITRYLSLPACPTYLGLRSAHPGGARARRARRAGGGRGAAGARSRERGGRGHDRPGPHDQARAPRRRSRWRARSSARSPPRHGAPG